MSGGTKEADSSERRNGTYEAISKSRWKEASHEEAGRVDDVYPPWSC